MVQLLVQLVVQGYVKSSLRSQKGFPNATMLYSAFRLIKLPDFKVSIEWVEEPDKNFPGKILSNLKNFSPFVFFSTHLLQ